MLSVYAQTQTIRNRHRIPLCMMLILMFAGFGFAQIRDRDAPLRADAVERDLMVAQVMEHLGPLMDHIAEQVAERYQLGQIPALRASAQAGVQQGDIKGAFRRASGAASLEPLLRTALASHLTKLQVESYLDFIRARKVRDKAAAAGQMVAWADQHFSLTPEQRDELGQVFVALTSARMTAQTLLDKDADGFMDVVANLRLDSAGLKHVLSPSQVKVWDSMVRERHERDRWGNGGGQAEVLRKIEVLRAQLAALKAGENRPQRAGHKLRGMNKDPRVNPNVRRGDDDRAREEWIRMSITARLAAHTDQLGELDAHAEKRLVLVAKGVVEQVLEAQDRGLQEDRGNAPGAHITSYPLYQATIKNVLSEEAYDRYQASQAHRVAFRQQAQRDLVVALLDTQMWLGEEQRERYKKMAAKLSMPNACGWVALSRLVKQVDPETLSLWQRRGFDAIGEAGARWEK